MKKKRTILFVVVLLVSIITLLFILFRFDYQPQNYQFNSVPYSKIACSAKNGISIEHERVEKVTNYFVTATRIDGLVISFQIDEGTYNELKEKQSFTLQEVKVGYVNYYYYDDKELTIIDAWLPQNSVDK